MTMTDPIADMLTRIRNANTVGHETVEIPASKMKKAIAEILKEEGYITDFDVIEDDKQGMIKVTMKYGSKSNQWNQENFQAGLKGLREGERSTEGTRRSGHRDHFHFQGNRKRQRSEKTGRWRRSYLLCMVGGTKHV